MLQWPYCSACRNGTIPQHNSLSSSLSNRRLITTLLQSASHLFLCVSVFECVFTQFTHILSTHQEKKLVYGTKSYNHNMMAIIIAYRFTTKLLTAMLLLQNISCKCLNSSFFSIAFNLAQFNQH